MTRPLRQPPVLTRQQRRIMNFIGEFLEMEGYAPTLDEIRAHLGLSAVSTVHEHVDRLIDKGYLSRGWNQSRSLVVSSETRGKLRSARIPLLGRPETIPVPESMLGRKETFALDVSGDSMVDEGILDGDTLIVEKVETADNGALVIALIEGRDAVVKRFFKRGSRVELVSANESRPPLVLDGRVVRVQGIVVGLLRRYR